MQGPLRIETPEHATAMGDELALLEARFRVNTGDAAAGRDLARQIVRIRMALTSYALRQQVRDTHGLTRLD